MQKIRGVIYGAAIAAVGLLAATVSPVTVLLATMGMFTFLAIARQMNIQRIMAMLKGYTKNVTRLRLEIRAKLHTGYTNYSESTENRKSRSTTTCGFAR